MGFSTPPALSRWLSLSPAHHASCGHHLLCTPLGASHTADPSGLHTATFPSTQPHIFIWRLMLSSHLQLCVQLSHEIHGRVPVLSWGSTSRWKQRWREKQGNPAVGPRHELVRVADVMWRDRLTSPQQDLPPAPGGCGTEGCGRKAFCGGERSPLWGVAWRLSRPRLISPGACELRVTGGGQQTRLRPTGAWLNARHHAASHSMPGLPRGDFRLSEAQAETAAFWGQAGGRELRRGERRRNAS